MSVLNPSILSNTFFYGFFVALNSKAILETDSMRYVIYIVFM